MVSAFHCYRSPTNLSQSSSQRRLAKDQASLRSAPPPDYFFPPNSEVDDLSSFSVYLAGPTSTPFENGVFLISLRMPANYPAEPPKATFKTKIFHPNIDDRSGDVCVGTLKRDWKSTLTLKDVLQTIRCLLIQPNPTSSLNEEAGRLLLEDYEEYARHARLITGIHASIPEELQELADEAKNRGEDKKSVPKPDVRKPMIIQSEDPKAPAEKRKIKQAVKPSSRTAITRGRHHEDAKPAVAKNESGSEDADSGKENAETITHAILVGSPLGKRAISETTAKPLATQALTGNAEEAEVSGTKSPKLKDGQTANAQQRKVIVSTNAAKPKAKTTKPTAKKVGLKRF